VSPSKPWHRACRVRSRPPSGAKTIRYSALTGSIGPGPRVICRNPKAGRSMALNHRGAPRPDHHGDFDEPQSEPIPGTGPRDAALTAPLCPAYIPSSACMPRSRPAPPRIPRLDEGGTLLVQGGYFSEEVGSWHQPTSRSNNAHTSCGSSEVVLLGSRKLIGSKPSGSFGVRRATRARAGLRGAALAV